MGRKGTKKGKKAQLKGNGTRREKRAAVNKKRTRRRARAAHRKPRRSIKQKRGGNPEDSPEQIAKRIAEEMGERIKEQLGLKIDPLIRIHPEQIAEPTEESMIKIDLMSAKLNRLLDKSYTLADETFAEIKILNLTPEEKKAITAGVGKSAERKKIVKSILQEYKLLQKHLLARMKGEIQYGARPMLKHLDLPSSSDSSDDESDESDESDSVWARNIADDMLNKKINLIDEMESNIVTTSNSLDGLKDEYTAELSKLQELASPSQSPKEPSDGAPQSPAMEKLQRYETKSRMLNNLPSFFNQEVKTIVKELKRLLTRLKTVVVNRNAVVDMAPGLSSRYLNLEPRS